MRGRAGSSLVEAVVAALLLEIGLSAILGTLIVAGRRLRGAEQVERGVAAATSVADSLAVVGVSGAGDRVFGRLRVRWSDGGGAGAPVRIEVLPADTTGVPLVELYATLPRQTP